MIRLVSQLESVQGKKKYGYLPKDIKSTVDEIVNQMERFPAVDDCYQVWWEFQCQIEDFYSERERQRPPLSDQKEFRSIKNAVIQEAENIRLCKVTFEDEFAETMIEQDATDISSLPYEDWKLWMVTQDDTAPMTDRDDGAAQLIVEAENGDPYAQYLTGRLYQDGPVLIPDNMEALYWFEQAASRVTQQHNMPSLRFFSPMIQKSTIPNWESNGWNVPYEIKMIMLPTGWGRNVSRAR